MTTRIESLAKEVAELKEVIAEILTGPEKRCPRQDLAANKLTQVQEKLLLLFREPSTWSGKPIEGSMYGDDWPKGTHMRSLTALKEKGYIKNVHYIWTSTPVQLTKEGREYVDNLRKKVSKTEHACIEEELPEKNNKNQ